MPIGTRLEVWRRKKTHTAGGLTRKDLKKNKNGKLVSKKVSAQQSRRSNLGSHKTTRTLRRGTRVRKKPKRYGGF
jgi:hypothetical protein